MKKVLSLLVVATMIAFTACTKTAETATEEATANVEEAAEAVEEATATLDSAATAAVDTVKAATQK